MNNLYRFVRSLLPYGLFLALKRYKNRNKVDVVTLLSKYEKYLSDVPNRSVFDDDSKYSSVISVQGFGCSGSGAVIDLLREYSCTDVIGLIDTDSSKAVKNNKSFEVDLLKHAGGLYELERYVGTSNIFQMDAMLHRLLFLISESPIFEEFEDVRPVFYEFISEIMVYYTKNPSRQYYNTFLDYKGLNQILISKMRSITQYRELSRKFLTSVFNRLKTDINKTHLVLDAICGDLEFDDEKNKDYIPGLKTIIVIRDPRDIYAFARRNDIRWIPTETATCFIEWYKYITSKMPRDNNNDHLVVRFEDLICKYESTVGRIEKFLDISPNHHTNKYSCLDPSISINNIGIWRHTPEYFEAYNEIAVNLSFFCNDD